MLLFLLDISYFYYKPKINKNSEENIPILKY